MNPISSDNPLPFTRPTFGEDEYQAVLEVMESGWLATGPKVLALEAALAKHIGGTGIQFRTFNSGTSALEASLLASGIGPGDEVIVPALSFIATANVVLRVGATPVFVDVDLHSRNLKCEQVIPALSRKSRAIIPVHFAGLSVELDQLYELGRDRKLVIIEDAAHAIGTRYKDREVGSFGNPVCFSFHPNKNITTVEGGGVASGDGELIKRLEALRFHGITRDAEGNMDVRAWGGKMNMPDLGAALGIIQLRKLRSFNQRRAKLAKRYLENLPRTELLVLPATDPGHSWHMFCVCIDYAALGLERAQARKFLADRGVNTGVHYPAMHLLSVFKRLGYAQGDFPIAERIGRQTLTLPLFPTMQDSDVDVVCEGVENLLKGAKND